MEKVNIQGVPETMLQTLFARAAHSQKKGHRFYDGKAIEMVQQLDYDFSKAEKDTAMSSGVIARTILLDRMVGDFIRNNPDAVVVNLACGLDTRVYRLDNGRIRWYNLDLPEVIHIRRRFFKEQGRISTIAKSATDKRWAAEVTKPTGRALILMEGLTMYLNAKDVQQIFAVISYHFSQATVFVETMNPAMVRHFKEKSIDASNAKFNWGIKNGKALAELLPDFRFVEEHSLTEGMAAFAPIYKLLDRLPAVRNISNKIIVLEKE